MTSNIVPGNIDGTFPIAGQDNSSQGFRDNFTATYNNFAIAATEITNLQNNKASTNTASNFNDNTVSQANFKDTGLVIYNLGTVTGTVTLDFSNGHYQLLTTSASSGNSINLTLANFPGNGNAGRLILDVTYSTTANTITLPTGGAISVLIATNVAGNSGGTITPAAAARYLYEIVYTGVGTTYLMHQLGAQYA